MKKGDRVEYTWSNSIIGKPPLTDRGTVVCAHRNGAVTVLWDVACPLYGHKMWCHVGMGLRRVEE